MSTSTRIREFKMPDVGEGLTEAEILKWYVRPGDAVTDGQVVCEVETAKAAVELPIPFDGAVDKLHFEEGTTVDVGTVIITVDTDPSAGPAEEAPAAQASAEPAEEKPAEEKPAEEKKGRQAVLVGYGVAESSTKRRPRKRQAVPAQAGAAAAQGAVQGELNSRAGTAPAPDTALDSGAPAAGAPTAPVPAAPVGARPLAKPPVRKLAKDLGVDLATVVATGAEGIITREDVHAAAQAPAGAPAQTTAAPAPAPAAVAAPAAGERERRVPVKGVRKATAAAMVDSAFTAPHVTEFVTVDVTRTMKLVQELKADPDMAGLRINPLLLVAKAFLVAIRRNPDVNASWDGQNQEIVYKDYVNLGIAAATPRGLIVPNIKDAGVRTLAELSTALSDLVATAREGKTAPGDMQGGTATITNVGVFGVDTGTPILNPRRVGHPGLRRGQGAALGAQGQGQAAQGDHARALLRPPTGRRRTRLEGPRGRRRGARAPASADHLGVGTGTDRRAPRPHPGRGALRSGCCI